MNAASPVILEGDKLRDPVLAGGKGASLARLDGAFPVPRFFVISADAFDEAGIKASATDPIMSAIAALGAGPFAVRSSGREEDGASAAHAGQFETELNVAVADVLAAAHRVWRSGFSETLKSYRRAHGLSDAPQPPAVVVQMMVQARAAGVAFSVDPVGGDRTVSVVSAVAGLADRLVAGDVDGDTYYVTLDGASLDVKLAGDAPVLTENERANVAVLARSAEAHFGTPQDIEWAIDDTGLKLLQSRPITTLRPAIETPAPTPDDLVIWDNSNIVESYPGVVSPLTFTFARYAYSHVYQAFSRLMGVSAAAVEEHRAVFENMLGRVDGRVYYNLLNWYRALALFPGFKANRAFMEGMMGVSEALPSDLADRIAPPSSDPTDRFFDRLNLGRVALGLVIHDLTIRGAIRRFYARLNRALARPDAEIDALSALKLAAEYRQLEQQLLAKWDAPLVNDFLCMIAFGAAQRAMQTWAGEEGLAYMSSVLIGQGDIVSAEPAKLIRQMGGLAANDPKLVERLERGDRLAVDDAPNLAAVFDRYIAKFGDRCTQELKLESRTLHEDPTQVLMAIAAAARSGDRPKAVEPAAAGNPVKGGVRRIVSGWLLKWAKARVRDRENLRFERTRLFGRVRRIFLAIGARLAEAGLLNDRRDVFSLTVDELLGAVEGAAVTGDLKALAALRHAEHEASIKRPDPPERFSIHGAHAIGVTSLTARPATAALGEQSETRTGLACCRGVVTARVRVIDDPRTQALTPGEILVARHTDPGWIAVFANAGGVIAERGSLLSHSAIVAREMGVPCIVGLKGATDWLKTGDTVRLDGGAGTVERTIRVEDQAGG